MYCAVVSFRVESWAKGVGIIGILGGSGDLVSGYFKEL